MKCRLTLATLGLLCLPSAAQAQYHRSSLLPLPRAGMLTAQADYPSTQAPEPPGADYYRDAQGPAPEAPLGPANAPAAAAPLPPGPVGGLAPPGSLAPAGDCYGGMLGPAEGCCEPVCDLGCQPVWFGSVAALVLTRDNANKRWTTFESGNEPNQIGFPPNSDWGGGWEVRLGRYFGCYHAVEAIYWGTETLDGEASFLGSSVPSGRVSTPFNVSVPPVLLDGANIDTFFDNAAEHRITRQSQFHNVEVNLLNGPLMTGPYGRFQFNWLMGFRYFNFQDELLFGSVQDGFTFGSDGGINEAYISSDVENNLYGFQIGGRADYFFTPRFSMFLAPKTGIYGNHVELEGRIYRGDGLSGLEVDSTEETFSFLGQIDAGLNYQFASNWAVFGGYRVLGATRVALADNQIPFYVGAADEWEDIDTNGDVIVHGAFAGLQFRF